MFIIDQSGSSHINMEFLNFLSTFKTQIGFFVSLNLSRSVSPEDTNELRHFDM